MKQYVHSCATALRGARRPLARGAGAALAVLLISGCCWKMVSDITLHMVNNAPQIVETVMQVAAGEYVAALKNTFKICSKINTRCPPRPIKPEKLDKLPIELDFNLLQEYLGANGEAQVRTVAPVSPEEIQSTADLDWLPAISESDNYKFVAVSHRPLYLYIFQVDATGELAWQFPRHVETEGGLVEVNPWPWAQGVNPIAAERIVRVPENDDEWYFLNEKGRDAVENFIVVASKYRQIELEEALAETVKAAQAAAKANPETFTQPIVKVPLVIPPDRTGLRVFEGGESAEVRTIQTESGALPYTPRSFTSDGDTILMARSVYHLPPRNP